MTGATEPVQTSPSEATTAPGSLGHRVALAASVWVAISLAMAFATFWWQASQVGGLAGFNLVLLIPSLGFGAVSFGLRILRWHNFLVAVGANTSLWESAQTQLKGFSLTMTPGKVGEVYKCYLVEQRTGVPLARTAPIVLFEKAMDAVTFSSLALLTASLLPNLSEGVATAARSLSVAILLGVAALLLLHRVRPEDVSRHVLRLIGRTSVGRRLASSLLLALSGSIDLLNAQVLSRNMLLSLAARTCDGLSLTWAAWTLGIALPPLAGIFALNSAGALGGLSMLPGGIGVVEASMSVILGTFGATPSAALAATLAARLFTFWIWVALGLYLLISASAVGLGIATPLGRSSDRAPGRSPNWRE